MAQPNGFRNWEQFAPNFPPGFYVRSDPTQYFTIGRVFMMMFCETASSNLLAHQSHPSAGSFGAGPDPSGAPVLQSPLRMVVIKGHTQSYLCIPIHTYNGRATLKLHVDPSTHALIYIRGREYAPLPGEELTLKAIMIDAAYPGVTLHHASRLNFAHTHTVQHNIPVHDLGTVTEESLSYLATCWSHVNNPGVMSTG